VISQISGRVLSRGADTLVVQVGGVGLKIAVTPRTAAGVDVGGECTLTTELVVREDSLTLYGFADASERDVFSTVQTVSGIGPRLAMTMLAGLAPDQIRAAVVNDDVAALTTVPGLGRKTAQRIILDLKDKLGGPAVDTVRLPGAAAGWRPQVVDALTGLGWSAAQAQEAVGAVAADPGGADLDVASALRRALILLDHSAGVGR